MLALRCWNLDASLEPRCLDVWVNGGSPKGALRTCLVIAAMDSAVAGLSKMGPTTQAELKVSTLAVPSRICPCQLLGPCNAHMTRLRLWRAEHLNSISDITHTWSTEAELIMKSGGPALHVQD